MQFNYPAGVANKKGANLRIVFESKASNTTDQTIAAMCMEEIARRLQLQFQSVYSGRSGEPQEFYLMNADPVTVAAEMNNVLKSGSALTPIAATGREFAEPRWNMRVVDFGGFRIL